MSSRSRTLLVQVGRFVVVAQAATWVSVLLFNIATHGWLVGDAPFEEHPVTAYVLANTVGMVISYRGARGWVFADRPPRHADGGRTAYVALNLAAMVLPVGCLAISRHVLGLQDVVSDNVAANGVGLVLAFVARFYLFRRFVFTAPVEADHPPEAALSPT